MQRISPGEKMTATTLVRKKPCYACFIACGRGTKVDGIEGEGPEYENAWAMGADCGIDDLAWVTRANYLCNDLGLDAISAGVTIACAMEMYEKGYISHKIEWGDGAAMCDLVKIWDTVKASVMSWLTGRTGLRRNTDIPSSP